MLILGAGGAARAVAFALAQAGAAVCVWARRMETGESAGASCGWRRYRAQAACGTEFFDAIVNSTPVGMHPHIDGSPLEANELNCRLVIDTIYRPRETKLLQLAARRGIETVSGVEMFVAQGTAQWEIWTGRARARTKRCAARWCALSSRKKMHAIGHTAQQKETSTDDDPARLQSILRLAKQGNLVPVYDTYTADLLTPVGAYLRLARDARYSCLLESVEGGENIARYTFIGANPSEVFRARAQLLARSGNKRVQFEDDPVENLRRLRSAIAPCACPACRR